MNLQTKYNNKGKYKNRNNYKINKRKYYEKPPHKVIFVNTNSIKDNHLKFTNYLQKGLSAPRNQVLKNHIDDITNNPKEFNKKFEGREISQQTQGDIKKIKRLNNILKLNKNYPNGSEILYKFTLINSTERGFQIIFTSNNDIRYIYLIDLYHLAIPSKNNQKHESFDLYDEFYNRVKYKVDINDVFFDSKQKEKITS